MGRGMLIPGGLEEEEKWKMRPSKKNPEQSRRREADKRSGWISMPYSSTQ